MNFYIDEKGFVQVSTAGKYSLLGEYLIVDVQGSMHFCNELLATISAIESGDLDNWEGTGNAHTLTIRNYAASIVNEYTDETLDEVPIDILKDAIHRWKEFITIQTPSSSDGAAGC